MPPRSLFRGNRKITNKHVWCKYWNIEVLVYTMGPDYSRPPVIPPLGHSEEWLQTSLRKEGMLIICFAGAAWWTNPMAICKPPVRWGGEMRKPYGGLHAIRNWVGPRPTGCVSERPEIELGVTRLILAGFCKGDLTQQQPIEKQN